ncbi:Leucine rich repeat containing protein [Euroglyphus maynei]|uniref:Leucine rich repeat containing protein n=1 Tax=Euroglyphus maynei TaxID=6958 RepID=A0A1Y3APS9_EURMA|nr:Leucine rich repeat containing protein [Euroglyphus maynei]
MTYSLTHVFRAIRQSMMYHQHHPDDAKSRPLFKELILSNSYWNELDDNLFRYIRFQRIIMIDMKSLIRLHSNVFNGTNNDISSYAFYELNSLRSIRIHSGHNDGLQRISAHSFDLAQPLSHPLTIDLRQNRLKLSTFEMDTFQQVNRPVNLDLSENNLTSLPQTIFERFLNTDAKNTIRLQTNPLHCNDCGIYWLLKDRQIYSAQIHDANCQTIDANLWRLDESTFRQCTMDKHYQPKLIFRNSAHSIHQKLLSSSMDTSSTKQRQQQHRHHYHDYLTFLFSSFIMILLI